MSEGVCSIEVKARVAKMTMNDYKAPVAAVTLSRSIRLLVGVALDLLKLIDTQVAGGSADELFSIIGSK